MSDQQIPKMDKARFDVLTKLQRWFNMINSLILNNEEFATQKLDSLNFELMYSINGTDDLSEPNKKLYSDLDALNKKAIASEEAVRKEKESTRRKPYYQENTYSYTNEVSPQMTQEQYDYYLLQQQQQLMWYYQQNGGYAPQGYGGQQQQYSGYPVQQQQYMQYQQSYPQQQGYQQQVFQQQPQTYQNQYQQHQTNQYNPATGQQQQYGKPKRHQYEHYPNPEPTYQQDTDLTPHELRMNKTASTPPVMSSAEKKKTQIKTETKQPARPDVKETSKPEPIKEVPETKEQPKTKVEQTKPKVQEPSKVEEQKPKAEQPKPVVEQPKPKVEQKTEPVQAAVKTQENGIEKKQAPAAKFTLESMIQFVKNCQDFTSIRQTLKDKVSEVNSRKVEQMKLPPVQGGGKQTYRKDTKKPYNQEPVTIQKRTEPLPTMTVQEGNKQQTTEFVITRSTESEEAKNLRLNLREAAKNGGYMKKIADRDEKEQETAEAKDLKMDARDMKFNLNLITQENFDFIKGKLHPIVTKNMNCCVKLIDLMIEKAWIEPKFAVIYARLSKQLSKLKDFKFNMNDDNKDDVQPEEKGEKGKKSKNPFKTLLIKEVQKIFNENEEEKEAAAKGDNKDRKLKIIGNVRFIGELLGQKVLSNKVSLLCVGDLMKHFLNEHFNKERTTGDDASELAEIFVEAIVELVEKLGEKFETGDKKSEGFDQVYKLVENSVKNKKPLGEIDLQVNNLSCDDFFALFKLLNDEILSKYYTRISALLQNLEERRENGWKQHLTTETGPKKLDEVRREIEEGEVEDRKEEKKVVKKSSLPLIDFEKALQEIFAKYEKGSYICEGYENPLPYDQDHVQSDLKKLMRVPDQQQAYGAYLRVVSDGKKQAVNKRIDVFKVVLGTEMFRLEDFTRGYQKTFHKLAGAESDFPFMSSAIAKILVEVSKQKKCNPNDFWLKLEDEDEEYFRQEVFDKMWQYADEDMKKDLEQNVKNQKSTRNLV